MERSSATSLKVTPEPGLLGGSAATTDADPLSRNLRCCCSGNADRAVEVAVPV